MPEGDSPSERSRKDSKNADEKKKHRYSFGGRNKDDRDRERMGEKSTAEKLLTASTGEFSTASTSEFGGISIREALSSSNPVNSSNAQLLLPDQGAGTKTPPHRRHADEWGSFYYCILYIIY
jgi:hypothetical protein